MSIPNAQVTRMFASTEDAFVEHMELDAPKQIQLVITQLGYANVDQKRTNGADHLKDASLDKRALYSEKLVNAPTRNQDLI